MVTADLLARPRVPWRLLDTDTLAEVACEAARHGDDVLYRRARAALLRRARAARNTLAV